MDKANKEFPERPESVRLFEAYQNQCLIARQWMEKTENLFKENSELKEIIKNK